MTYQQNETGTATGQPIELYRFIGTYNNYFLTSYAEEVFSVGETFQPIPISREKLKIGTQEDDNLTLEISMPFDHPMIVEYAYGNSPPRLQLELRRAHRQNPSDTVTMFNGLVQAFAVEGRIAKLRVPSIFAYILKGNMPVSRYQAPCNHVLYDSRCGVSEVTNRHDTTVQSVSGNTIVLDSLPFGDGECVTGVLRNFSGEARMITQQIGTQLQVTYPFSGLTAGTNVRVTRGCDHSFQTCRVKFANEARFGGFPLVPAKNPFTSNIKSGG